MQSITRRLSRRNSESSRRPSISEYAKTVDVGSTAFRFLDTDTIEKYATILAWQPPPETSSGSAQSHVQNIIQTLLPSSKARKRSSSRTLSWSVKSSDKDDTTYKICDLHKGLHPTVLSTAISGLERIVNRDVERILLQSQRCGSFTTSEIYLLQSAQDILATRLLLQEFCLRFRRSPRQSWYTPTHALEDVRCDACKLTKISSHAASLVGLRATIVAGLATDIPRYDQPCALLELIEMWMGIYEKRQAVQLLFKSAHLASKIKALMVNEDLAQHGACTIHNIQLRAALDIVSSKLQKPSTEVKERSRETAPKPLEAHRQIPYSHSPDKRLSRSQSSSSARQQQLSETVYPAFNNITYRERPDELFCNAPSPEHNHQHKSIETNTSISHHNLPHVKKSPDFSSHSKGTIPQQCESLSTPDLTSDTHTPRSAPKPTQSEHSQSSPSIQHKHKFSLSNLGISASPLRRSSSSKASYRTATTGTSSTTSSKLCPNTNDLTNIKTWTEPVPLPPTPQDSQSLLTWTPPRVIVTPDGSPAATIAASLGVLEDVWREANSALNRNTESEG